MTFTVSDAPADISRQTRDIVAMLADMTSNISGVAPQLSDNGWAGFCSILLMVETELTKLTGMIEGNQPD